jgi:hypothetical protein
MKPTFILSIDNGVSGVFAVMGPDGPSRFDRVSVVETGGGRNERR